MIDGVELTVEGLLQFGAGAGIVTAAIVVNRWYAKLAEVGEATWIKRLTQLEHDYQTDRSRWNNDRDRHYLELAKLREQHSIELNDIHEQLARCMSSREAETAELGALRAEVAALRDRHPPGR